MKYLMLLLLPLLNFYNSKAGDRMDSLLFKLDSEIDKRGHYILEKQQRITSLRSLLNENKGQHQLNFRYEIYDKLYNEYKSFIYDSAFFYSNKLLVTAHKINEKSLIVDAKIKMGFTLLSGGLYKETLDTLNTINRNLLSDSLKLVFYSVLARSYYDLADYSKDNYYSPIYNKMGNEYLDAAQSFCKKGTPQYMSLTGLRYMRNLTRKNIKAAIEHYEHLIRDFKLTKNQYAIDASSLGYIYRLSGNTDGAMELLAQAAITDIQSCIKETVAARDLAEILGKKGDTNRAYLYVKQSVDDAYFYGARLRKMQVSDILPIIEEKQLSLVEGRKKLFLLYSVILTPLCVLLIVLAIIVIKQFQKLKQVKIKLDESNQILTEVNFKLQEVNKIKEEYIGHFFNTISDYIEKIEKFTMGINRKLSNKRYDEIKDIINNVSLKKERESLYHSFDTTFIKIFPDFIEKFNSLFKDEDQIRLHENEPLDTEVRIFALIRLGINDHEKIAKILNYSVNTIYTYKAKIKNKSVVPNEFEERLMKIKAV